MIFVHVELVQRVRLLKGYEEGSGAPGALFSSSVPSGSHLRNASTKLTFEYSRSLCSAAFSKDCRPVLPFAVGGAHAAHKGAKPVPGSSIDFQTDENSFFWPSNLGLFGEISSKIRK